MAWLRAATVTSVEHPPQSLLTSYYPVVGVQWRWCAYMSFSNIMWTINTFLKTNWIIRCKFWKAPCWVSISVPLMKLPDYFWVSCADSLMKLKDGDVSISSCWRLCLFFKDIVILCTGSSSMLWCIQDPKRALVLSYMQVQGSKSGEMISVNLVSTVCTESLTC